MVVCFHYVKFHLILKAGLGNILILLPHNCMQCSVNIKSLNAVFTLLMQNLPF